MDELFDEVIDISRVDMLRNHMILMVGRCVMLSPSVLSCGVADVVYELLRVHM